MCHNAQDARPAGEVEIDGALGCDNLFKVLPENHSCGEFGTRYADDGEIKKTASPLRWRKLG
jgi:hypothetical protein